MRSLKVDEIMVQETNEGVQALQKDLVAVAEMQRMTAELLAETREQVDHVIHDNIHSSDAVTHGAAFTLAEVLTLIFLLPSLSSSSSPLLDAFIYFFIIRLFIYFHYFRQASYTNGAKHMVIGGVVGGVVGGVAGAVIGGAVTHGAGVALSTLRPLLPLAPRSARRQLLLRSCRQGRTLTSAASASFFFFFSMCAAAAGGAALGAAVGAGTGKLIAMDQNRIVGSPLPPPPHLPSRSGREALNVLLRTTINTNTSLTRK